jgi:4'-phosphopantetheinyl transferase
MIHWLLQSLDDCPDILRGDSTPAWLSAAEQARLHGFKVEKRRRDWLLGRWTAKNLVQRYLAHTTGEAPAPNTIFIGADADGAPYASCEGRGARGENRLPVSLSISHSHGTAFCGLVENTGIGDYEIKRLEIGDWRLQDDAQSPISNLTISQSLNPSIPQSLSLGCDIEFIEPREPSFVRSFFTAAEMAAVEQPHRMNSAPAMQSVLKRIGADNPTGFSRFRISDADFNRRGMGDAEAVDDAETAFTPADILTTAIWSGKEAVLKALREGLRIDTRRITCQFEGFAPPQDWTPFTVGVDDGIAAQFPGVWLGLWCLKDQFVLTMALLAQEECTTAT